MKLVFLIQKRHTYRINELAIVYNTSIRGHCKINNNENKCTFYKLSLISP